MIQDPNPSNLLQVVQDSFRGGMNLMDSELKLSENEYRIAFNVTNRFDYLEPLKDVTDITQGIAGKKQGIYRIGKTILLFAKGQAYYKNVGGNTFQLIPSFGMSTIAERIYIEIVPSSYNNFERKSSSETSTDITVTNTLLDTSEQCIVCQDGMGSQPQALSIVNGVPIARTLQTYAQWSKADEKREYVPVGCEMLFYDGILFIVSLDRKRLYRSVTGRPLDCVVNVTSDGDKGGDADTTFYPVGYNPINSIFSVSGFPDGFVVSIEGSVSFGITLDRDNTIFGEPTFRKQTLLSTGTLHQFAVVDINGDSAFITDGGIRSFNASKQLLVQSNNTPFSLKLGSLFEGIVQNPNATAAIVFNDYAFFSVMTSLGSLIAVYDTLTQVWCSFIQCEAVYIKQFASLLPFSKQLYCITQDDKIFELFSANTFLTAFVRSKAFATDNPKIEQQLDNFRCILSNTPKLGTILVTGNVDNVEVGTVENNIKPEDKLSNLTSEYSTKGNGYKVGYDITWNSGSRLDVIMHTGKLTTFNQSINQSAHVTK